MKGAPANDRLSGATMAVFVCLLGSRLTRARTSYQALAKTDVQLYPDLPAKATAYRNAYASMVYCGTDRDYEYFVATRVLMKSLAKLKAQADLVVLASTTCPSHWLRTL